MLQSYMYAASLIGIHVFHVYNRVFMHDLSIPVGIYGVGKAAVHLPALAVLSHIVPSASRTIAWVGKGIVYDTGGLSIKSKVHG